MDRYIGLDAHTSSCTVATIGQSGKRLRSHVVETNAKALIEVIRAVPKDRHLCLEEGPHSNWLYEVLSPHVQEIVVAPVNESPHTTGRRFRSRPESDQGTRAADARLEPQLQPPAQSFCSKGAATTVVGRAQDEPLYRHHVSLLDGGTKPNLAKLTIARQITAIVLALWRSMEVYDSKKLGHAT